MTLAFQALAVFLLALPGVIVRYAYKKALGSRPAGFRPVTLRPVVEEIAYSVVLAACLHAVFAPLANRIVPINFRAVAVVVVGNFGDKDRELDVVISALTVRPFAMLGYFLAVYSAAALIGIGFGSIARLTRFDIKYPLLRLDAHWHYLLTGAVLAFREKGIEAVEIDGAYVSVVADVGGKSYLYVGIIDEFYVDADGELERFVLRGVYRRDLTDDQKADDRVEWPDQRYYYVDADYLVFKYSDVRNFGVHYIRIDPPPTEVQPATSTADESPAE